MDLTSQWNPGVLFASSPGQAGVAMGNELFVIADDGKGNLTQLGALLSSTGALVHHLESEQGLTDLVASLKATGSGQPYGAIHILSHGHTGAVRLGQDLLTGVDLESHTTELAELGDLLTADGDLLLYGCNVGQGEAGATLLSRLADLTGADVAASDDITGTDAATDLHDWDLEVHSGNINLDRSTMLGSLGWEGSLAVPLLPFVKFIGEAVAGAFIGYGVEQLLSSDPAAPSREIVLQFPSVGGATAPEPIKTGIDPNAFVKSAVYLDTTGDLVDIRLSGKGSFKLTLSGGLTNLADALSLELQGADATTHLSVSVSPISQPINAGSTTSTDSQTGQSTVSGIYNRMYSPGFTTVDRLFASSATGRVGNIELSAAIVNHIDLNGHDINSIQLDTGYTTLVDRVNTTTLGGSTGFSTTFNGNTITGNTAVEEEIIDFSIIDDDPTINGGFGGGAVYKPVTGLIDLGNVTAQSLERLIINGAVSAGNSDPNDTSTTSDIRGVVNITNRLGTVSAKRSRLDGTIQAGSIGKIDMGRIDGTISTTDATKALFVTLPANFSGFVNSAGHLNMAYTFYSAVGDPDVVNPTGPSLGRITSDAGISGIGSGEADPIFAPHGYKAIVHNTSTTKGIADIRVNGALSSRWISNSHIGNILAHTITPDAVIEAGGNIGTVQALRNVVVPPEAADPQLPAIVTNLDGTFVANGSIGNIRSATGIGADFRATTGSIGSITALSGGITSNLIEAGVGIGQITVQTQSLNNTKVVTQTGSISGLKIYSGTWGGTIIAGNNMGNIYVEKGSLHNLSLAAVKGSVGAITVKGSNTIVGGSYTAATTIGLVTVRASRGTGIQGALFKAGDENGQYVDSKGELQTSILTGFDVMSLGATLLPSVEAGMPANPTQVPAQPLQVAAHGMEAVQILAGQVGAIRSRSTTGSGIVGLPFSQPPGTDIDPDELAEGYSVIHAKIGNITAITGTGNGHGIANLIAVAEGSIGQISGISEVKGNGIENGRFNANGDRIGPVEGRGGVAGGHGMNTTYIQAVGLIDSIKGVANANEGHGLHQVDARAGLFGSIEATVLGGKGGNAQTPLGSGIVKSYFKGSNNTKESTITYADQPNTPVPNQYHKKGDGNIFNGINSVKVDVRSFYGRGIDTSTFDVKGGILLINSRAFGNSAIYKSEFTSAFGSINQIAAEAINSGNAIDASTFISENESIGTGALGVTVKTGGLTAADHAITGSLFEADANIGTIKADSKGGVAINGSTFTADSNFTNEGTINIILANAYGENFKSSAAIKGSTFLAARINRIEANVLDFDGGDAILGSRFTARTATYDPIVITGPTSSTGTGSVNNTGSIGLIKVSNASRIGDGISDSKFLAGAAGLIGTIDIDVISKKLALPVEANRAASGRAVHLSEFRASSLDPDQTILTGRIGTITIKAGRVIPEYVPGLVLPPNRIPPNDQSSLEGSGINASYFAAYGGIGQIKVESIGTAVFGSTFISNGDPLNGVAGILANSLAQKRGAGRIDGIDVKSTGLYGSGTLLSLFAGAGIGNVTVAANGFPIPDPTAMIRQIQNLGNLASALQSGPILPIMQAAGQSLLSFLTTPIAVSSSPVTLTAFVAIRESIGAITITNTARYGNYPFLGSLVYARSSYGPVTTTPVAVKGGADFLAESFLQSMGFTSPNVFTLYPLPTTFIGTRRAGGNLPAPLA